MAAFHPWQASFSAYDGAFEVAFREKSHRPATGGWFNTPAASLAQSADLVNGYIHMLRQGCKLSRKHDGEWRESNYMLLRRGAYVVAAGLAESVARAPHTIEGSFIDLFGSDLPVRESVTLEPGTYTFLYDLARKSADHEVLAVTGRVESVTGDSEKRIQITTPAGVSGQVIMRRRTPPQAVKLETMGASSSERIAVEPRWEWDGKHCILRVWYHGSPDGITVCIRE